MKKALHIITLLIFNCLAAQSKPVVAVYFEFDKFNLHDLYKEKLVDFVKKLDSSALESIQIYGYCDDRGTNYYNFLLSKKRVSTVQNILIENGFNKSKIVILEGKGRVALNSHLSEDIDEKRFKNRRVDIVLIKKNNYGARVYSSVQDNHKIGDRIYLENVLFPLGSSKLTQESKDELDRIAVLLRKQKSLEFKIIGHVCCTSNYYSDAIDKETTEPKLSINRAKTVYLYLMKKGVNSLRMHYLGSGNKFPLGRGDALDRRVEFLIIKN